MRPEGTKVPLIIGVTGGIGAGKSRILKILQESFQARILLADQVAAELEEPGQEGLRLLTEHFGTEILDKDGRLDRAAFAEKIFKDPKVLHEANAILHPLTWQAILDRIEQMSLREAEGADSGEERGREVPALVIAVEAALFDEKSKKICDSLWYVDATEENRIGRLMENRGYTREKCLDIMRNQPSREEFLALADRVIDNNGTVQEAKAQIVRLLDREQEL